LHSTPGIGNAVGALYQAKRGHSPLVVIGGDAGVKYQAMDAQMAGDLVAFMEPVTKWATMVQHPASLLRVLRRAVKIAATPPRGPVYVCLPEDVLDAEATERPRPNSLPSTRTLPEPALLQQAAEWLVSAKTPMIFVGDGIAFSGAQAELAQVAELLGAEVWEADAGEVNLDYTHPLYRGMTGHMFGSSSLPILSRGDVNLVCGTYIVPEVFPELGDVFAAGSRTIHIDLNLYEIGKNHPVDLGMLGDPKLSLAALAEQIRARLTPEQREAAAKRTAELSSQKKQKRDNETAQDHLRHDATPVAMSRFVEELASQLPEDAIIFDEALTNSPPISRYLPPRRGGSYFLTRGGSLGVGFPGAIGVSVANPGKTVIGFSGDGGAMYTIQALWSASRHNLPTKFVVCNNGSYRLLQLNITQYWKERQIQQHDYPLSFDLSYPPLHFAQMANGMGVAAARVEKPWEVAPAIKSALAHPGPFLIDLVLEGDTHPDLIGNTCGQ
jgi:thiamine pyrophosphate-dependent acetolactate synthase large subunit-like protein